MFGFSSGFALLFVVFLFAIDCWFWVGHVVFGLHWLPMGVTWLVFVLVLEGCVIMFASALL